MDASACPFLTGRQSPSSLSPSKLRSRVVANKLQPVHGADLTGTYYADYLELERMLSLQNPMSDQHEELLFVIVHQSYELWFKMIIADLARVHAELSKLVTAGTPSSSLCQPDLAKIVSSLERIRTIQPMLLHKLTVLETMTPMEFMEFRDLLVPASGFQSWQFRIIEVMLGLSIRTRTTMNHDFFKKKIKQEHYDKIMEWENKPSIQALTEKWLEQLPWLNPSSADHLLDTPQVGGTCRSPPCVGFDWMKQYKAAVGTMFNSDESNVIQVYQELGLSGESLEEELRQVRANRATFESLFDESQHRDMIERGVRTFSQKAILNALFVHLYRDLTELHTPFRILTLLVEIDDGFTSWRYRHAQMAHRMIGRKMGTGASSGADHLIRVAQNSSCFNDLKSISTFLIPKSQLPQLPESVLAAYL